MLTQLLGRRVRLIINAIPKSTYPRQVAMVAGLVGVKVNAFRCLLTLLCTVAQNLFTTTCGSGELFNMDPVASVKIQQSGGCFANHKWIWKQFWQVLSGVMVEIQVDTLQV